MIGSRIRPEGEGAFYHVTRGFAWAIVLLIAGMGVVMLISAWPSIELFGPGFLTGIRWDAVREVFGAAPFIYGSVVSSLVALALAIPLGLGAAIFLAELAPGWFRAPMSFMIELLAAIPSIVYGMWGFFVLVPILRARVEPWLGEQLGFLPLFSGPPYGVGMLAAGLILTIMILPTIASISRDVILAVPGDQREAMFAVGATRWETIWHAVLPYGRTGLVGAVMLALGRAIGETMAVTMVIGNRHEISASLLAPADTMASVIANEFAEAVSAVHLGALIELGLILFLVTMLLNIAARFLIGRLAGQARGGRGEMGV